MTTPDGPEPTPPRFPRGITPEAYAAMQRAIREGIQRAAEAHVTGSTPLDEGCVALHEYFTALVRAGFTDQQALYYLSLRSA